MWTDRGKPSGPRPAAGHGQASGFTLIETIVAIVVLGAGLAGMLLVFQTSIRHSADPLVLRQMTAIADELLEEIQLKPFATSSNTAPSGCARDTYNDVRDYNGYTSTGVCMIDGVAVAGLTDYDVSVTVAAAALSTAADALRIVITVTHDSDSFQLVGWRANYAP